MHFCFSIPLVATICLGLFSRCTGGYRLPVQRVEQSALKNSAEEPSFIDTTIFGRSRYESSATEDDVNSAFYDRTDGTEVMGLPTFAHLNYTDCFDSSSNGTFDIAIVGAPFDLGVSFRPGQRFGPNAVRMASQRMAPAMAWSMDHGTNPFRDWATVTDCSDIANTPYEKLQAIKQLTTGWNKILAHEPKTTAKGDRVRFITLGGDHTITLPALRAIAPVWGPVAVIHFDSHLDTWDPDEIGGGISNYSEITHGTLLHLADKEGLLAHDKGIHVGTRSMMFDQHYDLDNDARCGFKHVKARELDVIGIGKVIERIVERVGDSYVYLTIDIDVLDPAFAPATGTIEPGGWTTREVLAILTGLSQNGVKIVAADIAEFSPIYDNASETTGLAIVQLVYEILQWMINVPVR